MKNSIENFEIYLNNLNYSKNTITAYIKDLKLGINLIEKYKKQPANLQCVLEMNKIDWREILNELYKTLNIKSISRFLASWKKWANYEKLNNNISVVLNVQKPKFNNNQFQFNDQQVEIKLFLNEFEKKQTKRNDQRNLILVYLLYSTGIRIEEALNIKWLDLFDKYIKIHGKGNKVRFVPLFQFLKEHLNNFKNTSNNDAYIFLNKNNCKLHSSAVARIFRNICAKINIKTINPHQLRHICASDLLKEGCSLRFIQLLLGHANLETTKYYIKYSSEELQNVHHKYLK